MSSIEIIPKVDETQEFIEIANDFSNPLDLVREAISNAYDAQATRIDISFGVTTEYGEKILKITLKDNGNGMDEKGLQSFFDLGNSLYRNNPEAIGEKGHGTKVYFNSKRIVVKTIKNGKKYNAVMDEPFKNLHDRTIPKVLATIDKTSNEKQGTTIEIYGYNNNRRDRFTHDILKDYIMWFTRHGAFENIFNLDRHKNNKLFLQGLGRTTPEKITWGHFFPEENSVPSYI